MIQEEGGEFGFRLDKFEIVAEGAMGVITATRILAGDKDLGFLLRAVVTEVEPVKGGAGRTEGLQIPRRAWQTCLQAA